MLLNWHIGLACFCLSFVSICLNLLIFIPVFRFAFFGKKSSIYLIAFFNIISDLLQLFVACFHSSLSIIFGVSFHWLTVYQFFLFSVTYSQEQELTIWVCFLDGFTWTGGLWKVLYSLWWHSIGNHFATHTIFLTFAIIIEREKLLHMKWNTTFQKIFWLIILVLTYKLEIFSAYFAFDSHKK